MKIIGVNGGNGVLLYPFRKNLIGNIEIRPVFKTPNNIQWKLNFGDIPLYNHPEDMTKFSQCDVVIGAPNCGHSSVLAYSRAKMLSDPLKDESLDLFIMSILYYKPKIFLMENLPKVLDMVSEDVWEKTFPNYELVFNQGSVMNWGNSQKTRTRLVLIGINKSYYKDQVSYLQYHFSNVYRVNELKKSGDLLKGLDDENPDIGHIREDIDDTITMYAGFKISLKKAQKFWLENHKLKRWPVTDKKFTTAPGVYRNLIDDFPAVARKANRQFNHNGLQMSPRELARVQGIPTRFKIWVDENRKGFCINKGRATVTKCPPYEIGKWFSKQLKKMNYHEHF